MSDVKYCPSCRNHLPLDSFAPRTDRKTHNGYALRTWCRECENERSRLWYARNREKRTLSLTSYRKSPKGRQMVYEAVKRYRAGHRDICNQWQTDYYHRKNVNARYRSDHAVG